MPTGILKFDIETERRQHLCATKATELALCMSRLEEYLHRKIHDVPADKCGDFAEVRQMLFDIEDDLGIRLGELIE